MTEKVFIADHDEATIICPQCNFSTTKDMARYKKIDTEVRLKIKCTCGHGYSVFLERRKQFRKATNLTGNYILRSSSGAEKKGSLNIKNISRAGLKLEIKQLPDLKIGSTFSVEFRLDDKNATLIKKDVVVKVITQSSLGVEFTTFDTSEPGDKALGFYLFA